MIEKPTPKDTYQNEKKRKEKETKKDKETIKKKGLYFLNEKKKGFSMQIEIPYFFPSTSQCIFRWKL